MSGTFRTEFHPGGLYTFGDGPSACIDVSNEGGFANLPAQTERHGQTHRPPDICAEAGDPNDRVRLAAMFP